MSSGLERQAQFCLDNFCKRQDRLKIVIVSYDQKIEEITRYRDGVSFSEDATSNANIQSINIFL
jgi:hypothetical protein